METNLTTTAPEAEAEAAANAVPDIEKMRALYWQIDAIKIPDVSGVYTEIANGVWSHLRDTLEYLADELTRVAR